MWLKMKFITVNLWKNYKNMCHILFMRCQLTPYCHKKTMSKLPGVSWKLITRKEQHLTRQSGCN